MVGFINVVVRLFLLSLAVALGVAFECYALASFMFCFFTWLIIYNVGGAIARRIDEIQ